MNIFILEVFVDKPNSKTVCPPKNTADELTVNKIAPGIPAVNLMYPTFLMFVVVNVCVAELKGNTLCATKGPGR